MEIATKTVLILIARISKKTAKLCVINRVMQQPIEGYN